jgi:hypothetical protein
MAIEENGFLEYLQLQGSDPDLVTKSELIAEVRHRGYSIGERQLSFYVTEGILPKSVRVGSRAGAYPRIVVNLLSWVLRARDGGVTVDAIRELLPVWKLLVRARRDKLLDLAELEYVARQHVTSVEGSMTIPAVVSDVLTTCENCMGCIPPDIEVLMKDGTKRNLSDRETTLGFAIAKRLEPEGEDSELAGADSGRSTWFARTRITLAAAAGDVRSDPTTVILGISPTDAPPEDRAGRQQALEEPAEV